MGEYADMEIARQQLEAGERMAREHSRMTPAQRRTAGQAEHAANQAKHGVREQALVAGLAHAAIQRHAHRSAGLEIVRIGVLEAKRGVSVVGPPPAGRSEVGQAYELRGLAAGGHPSLGRNTVQPGLAITWILCSHHCLFAVDFQKDKAHTLFMLTNTNAAATPLTITTVAQSADGF